MRKFEDATARPYGYLVLDLKWSISEQDRLQTDIFDSVNQQAPIDGDMSGNGECWQREVPRLYTLYQSSR